MRTRPAVSNALQGVASKLPGATRVFCGHEYTVGNLQFAKSVEPDNAAVSDKLDWSTRILAEGGYTIPSTASRFCTPKTLSGRLFIVSYLER